MSRNIYLGVLLFSIGLITACGGGGNTTPDGIPQAVISAPNEVNEGTTEIDIDGSTSSDDGNGTLSTYLWAIDNNGGITNLGIADSTGVTTQIIGVPNTIDEDITITISLIVTDNEGNESPAETQSITLINDEPIVVNTGSIDGMWDSPCFNTTNNTSLEQTLTINGTSMTSRMNVYSAGQTASALNCILPATSTGLIVADSVTTLSFGSQTAIADCTGGQAVNTSIDILSITVGAETATTTEDINGNLALLTNLGEANVLPSSTNICLLTNGNLLYAGSEYTPAN